MGLWLLIVLLQLTAAQIDLTLIEETSGADVVRAVNNKIRALFGYDRQFLRRIAYIESRDGTDSYTYRSDFHGGIWQVDQATFIGTQDTETYGELVARHQRIRNEFGISWTNLEWSDLRSPLYSGLAARLFLSTVRAIIPCTIAGQAAFWQRHYNSAGIVGDFVRKVEALRRREGCPIKSDLMIVMDESGSVGESNFDNVREYAVLFTNLLTIHPTHHQIGVITYSTYAQLEFGLATHSDNATLREAIRNIPYDPGATNIPDALCAVINTFNNTADAREDSNVFRIAIVMTDGISTWDDNACNFRSVSEAADALHDVYPPILVFGLGIGPQYREENLVDIASGPEYISPIRAFAESQLQCVQVYQEDQICYTISVPVNITEVNQGSLVEGEQIRWQFDVPESGRLFSLQVEKGEVALYASTEITTPNSALYQWSIQTSSFDSIFIIPNEFENLTELYDYNTTESLIPVYITVTGLRCRNTFILTNTDESAARRLKINVFLVLLVATVVFRELL